LLAQAADDLRGTAEYGLNMPPPQQRTNASSTCACHADDDADAGHPTSPTPLCSLWVYRASGPRVF
jgi:hypothetical protein